MADIDNEKAQFMLAAARTLKWKHGTATWGTGFMTFNFNDGKGPFILPVDHELPGWDDLSPEQKLTAAESVLKAAAALAPAFDPTIPGWIDQTPAA